MEPAPEPPRSRDERIGELLRRAEDCKAFLREQKEIRVFIEDAWNRGHQASSLLLARHLARMVPLSAGQTITWVCRNESARALLAGFLAREGFEIPTRMKSLEEIRAEPWIELGCTGASDAGHDLSRRARCRTFLWMQPFRWENPERILCRTGYRAAATRDFIEAHPWTRGLGLSRSGLSLGPPSEPDWARLGDSRSVAVIRAALAAADRHPEVSLLPAYSVGANGMLGISHLVLRNLLFGLREALDGGLESAVLVLDLSPDTRQDAIDRLKPILDRCRPGWSRETCTDVGEDVLRIERRIGRLRKGKILLVHTPEVKPQPLFDYVLSRAKLPPVFEGLGTEARAVTLGKPFLQVCQRTFRAWQLGRRPRAAEMSYPLLPGFSSLPFRCQTAADTLIRLKPRPDLLGSFLLDCARGEERLHSYFEALAERCRDPRRDRLNLNLGLLELLRRFPSLRGRGLRPG